MTAATLLKSLVAAGCDPAAGPVGVMLTDPPPELAKYVPVLGTGLRALLLGKLWHGITADGRNAGPDSLACTGPLKDGSLDPAELLPRDVTLLTVWGNGPHEQWDRLGPWAADDLPECFADPPIRHR